MKRISILFAAAAMVLAASCQKDNFTSEGQEAVVTFCTILPGVGTKAVADGETANTLYYEVYTVDAEGNSDKLVYDGTASVSGKSGSVNVRLIKNKAYNVYFWAQYESDDFTSPYNVEDLTNIGVSYENALANDDRRDAFYTVLKSVAYSGSEAETVTLRRAFAQVNLATEDLALVLSHGSRPTTSSIEITNLATSFNTFTGEGTGSADAVFATAYIPGLNDANVADYTVETVEDLNNVGADNKSYDYLATAYVLVPAAEGYTSISKVNATVNFASDASVQISAPEVTIQKNWRTNIYGNVLTGSIDYNVGVDQNFENDYTAEFFPVIDATSDITIVAGEENTFYLAPGEYELPESAISTFVTRSSSLGNVTFIGSAEGVILKVSTNKNYGGMPITFRNVTLKFGNSVGFVNAEAETYSNCAIEGSPYLYAETSFFEGCDLANARTITASSEVSFEDCENLSLSNIKASSTEASISIKENGEIVADSAAAESVAASLIKGEGATLSTSLAAPMNYKGIYGTPTSLIQKGGVFDGNNYSLCPMTTDYNAYTIEIWGGTIKNLSITTALGRGIMISYPSEDIYIENVVVDGPGYAINTTEHNGKNLFIINSVIKGWTSLAGLDAISFSGCTFGENISKYWQKMGYEQDYDRLIRFYGKAVLTDCTFEQGFYIDLSPLNAASTVTLTNCVCGETVITAENYESYITIELPAGRTLSDCVIFK